MKTKEFLTTYKKVLGLVAMFVVLLITCLGFEAFTAGGPNKFNDFIITPHLLTISLYSLGVMFGIIIPVVLYKVYNEHLVSGADDEADYTLMAQIAISILSVMFFIFLIGILIDHFSFDARKHPNNSNPYVVFTGIKEACITFYEGIAVVLIVLGVSILIIKSFKKLIAPSVTSVMSNTWTIVFIAIVCCLLLLARCNHNRNRIDYDSSSKEQIQSHQKDPVGGKSKQPPRRTDI